MTTIFSNDMAGVGDEVTPIEDFFRKHSIWRRFSRNRPASSCKDAANVRERLGTTGIALRFEMRSFLLKGRDVEGDLFVLAHTRGDQHFDLSRIREVCNLLSEPKRAQVDGVDFGLVNPVSTAISLREYRLKQVFDPYLIHSPAPTGTMMTNAGHAQLGIEFRVDDLIEGLNREFPGSSIVASISDREPLRLSSVELVCGGNPFVGYRMAEELAKMTNKSAGSRAGGGIGMIPINVRTLPALAAAQEYHSYAEIFPRVVQRHLGHSPLEHVLYVPVTLSIQRVLTEWAAPSRADAVFDLAGGFEGKQFGKVLGMENDVISLNQIKGMTLPSVSADEEDVFSEAHFQYGKSFDPNRFEQRIASITNQIDSQISQLNGVVWYLCSSTKRKALKRDNIEHLHDHALSRLCDLWGRVNTNDV